MKYDFKISQLAVVCALCASAVCPAFGAASVRSLGGAGAYSGTASAAAAKPASGTNAARAGSMRVTAAQSKPVATTGGNSTSDVSTSRLSIGKYLGGGTSVSGGSSIKNQTTGSVVGAMKPGSAASESELKDLTARVENLEVRSGDIYDKSDVDSALGDKQDKLVAGDKYVVVDGGDIYLDLDNLTQDLKGTAGDDGREVAIETDKAGIKWQYAGDGDNWTYLASWDELKGEKGDKGVVDPDELNAAVASAVAGAGFLTASDLAPYATTADLEERVAAANAIAAAAQSAADAANAALENYATNDRIDDIVAGNIDLTGYAKTADVASKDAFSILAATVDTKANAADVPTNVSQLVNDSGFLTEHQSLAEYAKANDVYTKGQVDTKVAEVIAGDMTEALNSYAQTTYVNTELAKKADTTAIPTKTSELTNDSDFLAAPEANGTEQVLAVYNGKKVWLDIKDKDN